MVSRVLAIEGSVSQRAVLERLFSMVGMNAKLLESTDELQEVLENQDFDFICLGMYIPGVMSSLDACRFIRDLPGYQYTPIVLLTSSDANTTQTEAFSAGITDIFNRNEMLELSVYLTRHIERSRPIEGRLLYVEDSVSQQLSMMKFLESSGLHVDAFDNAEAALAAFEAQHYDLVLTDIVLPGEISGLQLVHKIRRLDGKKGDVPILVLTGYDDPARRIELLQRGASDYVSKPVVHHEVFVRVRTLIDNQQLIYRLQEQTEKLEQQAKNQLSFLASISHDVRTPLNGILGVLDLVRSEDVNLEHKDLLDIAMQSGEHLISIIDDVLDLSRAEVDQFIIDLQPINIKKIAANVIQNLKPNADQKSLHLSLSYSDNMPEMIEGDPKRLYQILMNLISNALKFTNKGGVDVTLEFLNPCSGDKLGTLNGSVQDTGRGIPRVQCETIFNKFQQVDAVARSIGGSGLGLAIVRTIIETWGGKVGVTSKLGEGSKFWFSLPIGRWGDKDLQERHTEVEAPLFTGNELNVLLVEDNHINQLVAGHMLERLSIPFSVAKNGQEAIDMLEAGDFNLVLMDCQMPVMDGYEASGKIRHSNKAYEGIYIIALTASAMIDEERKCYRMGMNDFLAKPLLFGRFVKALNTAYQVIC